MSAPAGGACDVEPEVSGTEITLKTDHPQATLYRLTGWAESHQVERCYATQWFRYAMGRGEQAADTCSLRSLTQTFHAAGADLRQLPAAIVQTPAFLYRRPLAQGSP